MRPAIGILLAVGALALFVARPVSAQTPQTGQPTTPEDHVHPAPHATAKGQTTAETHDMHAMHMMMADLQASHAKLQGLVEKMNAAKGSAKTDAIAALVTEIVQSQHAMHEAMATHMAECPMLKTGTMEMKR